MLKVSPTEECFDTIIYDSNPQTANFDDLPFYGEDRLITRQ